MGVQCSRLLPPQVQLKRALAAASSTGSVVQWRDTLQAGTAGKVLPWAVWWASISGDGTTLVPDTTTGAGRWVSVVTMIVAHPMAGTRDVTGSTGGFDRGGSFSRSQSRY